MKRNLTFILAMLIFVNITACAGSETTTDTITSGSDVTTAPVEDELTDGLPEVNMDGFVFSVYNNSQEKMTWTNTTLDVESQTGEVLNDAIYKRNRNVEERFNCVIDVLSEGDQISASQIEKEVMAGDSNFDL
jgi:hypothetical protein